MAAGAALPVAILLGYQEWAFGNPFLPAQHYMPSTEFSTRGWNGFDWPSPELLWRNLVDPRYGIFAFGPLLGLGLAAPWVAGREPGLRRSEVALALGLLAGLLLFTSANWYSALQWNTGFRMLTPAVPLLFLASASVLVRLPRRLAIALAVLAVAHQWCLAMVREDAVGSVRAVLEHGFVLPWLTVLWKMGDQYLPILQRTGPLALPVLLVAALAIVAVWWPDSGRMAVWMRYKRPSSGTGRIDRA
jgi:hypothetical protein